MSGAIYIFPDIEFFLILVILIVTSFALQTWLRRKDISDVNLKFVKQFVRKAITVLILIQALLVLAYSLLK
jgi:hypothetical protein